MPRRARTEDDGTAHPSLRSPAFVGRQRELATLSEALADPPTVLLIEGEAGIGKSRLVRELLATPAVPRARSRVWSTGTTCRRSRPTTG